MSIPFRFKKNETPPDARNGIGRSFAKNGALLSGIDRWLQIKRSDIKRSPEVYLKTATEYKPLDQRFACAGYSAAQAFFDQHGQ